MPLLVYYFNRRNIPRLFFDGIWKKKEDVRGIVYFLRVKRHKGEGRAEGVHGLESIRKVVYSICHGIKDSLDKTKSI